jgi:hypothetical protein
MEQLVFLVTLNVKLEDRYWLVTIEPTVIVLTLRKYESRSCEVWVTDSQPNKLTLFLFQTRWRQRQRTRTRISSKICPRVRLGKRRRLLLRLQPSVFDRRKTSGTFRQLASSIKDQRQTEVLPLQLPNAKCQAAFGDEPPGKTILQLWQRRNSKNNFFSKKLS